jgi:hypothetical protein
MVTRGRLVCAANSKALHVEERSWFGCLLQPETAAEPETAVPSVKVSNTPAKARLVVVIRMHASRKDNQTLPIKGHAVNRLVGVKTSPTTLS